MLDVKIWRQSADDEFLRCSQRGFSDFVADMLYASQQQHPIKSLCEIGVSQGSKIRHKDY